MYARTVGILLVLNLFGAVAYAQSLLNLGQLRDKHTLNDQEVQQMFHALGISSLLATPPVAGSNAAAEKFDCQGVCEVHMFLMPWPLEDGLGDVVVISRAVNMDMHPRPVIPEAFKQ